MKIQLTSFSASRTQPKANLAENRNRITNFEKPATTKPKESLLLKKPTNKILELSKNFTAKSVNTTENKKGVALYQQIEGNKLFSPGTELINRFHFKI